MATKQQKTTGAEAFASVQTAIETVTPKLAEKWLGRNNNFRPLDEDRAIQMAEDMQNGKWDLNGESIKFNEEGTLIDGQHRLTACTLSGASFETIVVRGVRLQENIDMGQKRSFAQILHFRGEKNVGRMSAAVRSLYRWEKYGTFEDLQRGGVSNDALSRTLEAHPDIRRSVVKTENVRKIFYFLSMHALLHYLFTRAAGQDKADAFYDVLAYGNSDWTDTALDPRIRLRNMLIEDKMKRDRLLKTEVAALTIKAWNSFVQERPMAQLGYRSAGPRAEQFPEIFGLELERGNRKPGKQKFPEQVKEDVAYA